MNHLIPELLEVEQLIETHNKHVRPELLGTVTTPKGDYPVMGLVMGSLDPHAPTCAFFAGVHGLERVGSHVLLSFLRTLFVKRAWDKDWERFFERNRLIALPVVNPAGFALNRRSNGRGVDLMRNAPVEAQGKLLPGVSGQRFSARLPWYRGAEGIELETQAVASFVEKYLFDARAAISIDLHSGFGMRDRLWYPWAKSADVFPHAPALERLMSLFEATYPYHVYKIEPQHHSYMTHGDLWDWLYMRQQEHHPSAAYLPLTLEMGSWLWVKKNPWQVFSANGLFNPVKQHRYARTMRRHLHLLEFLLRSVDSHHNWA